MLTHLASGAPITEQEWQQVWIQRQIRRAIAEIKDLPYRSPLEPEPPYVMAHEPGEPERIITPRPHRRPRYSGVG